MVSLDVEILFTNVPVGDTVKIVMDNVYDSNELALPNIPSHLLRDMLLTSTIKPQLSPLQDSSMNSKIDAPWINVWGLT